MRVPTEGPTPAGSSGAGCAEPARSGGGRDEFAWLRQRDDPEVLAFLEAENRRTEESMAPARSLREELYREFLARLQETDVSAPVRRGEWVYYRRTLAGKQYSIHCRYPAPESAAELPELVGALALVGPAEDPREQTLLDENALAVGHDYFQLGVFEPSPDGRYLAWSADTSGSEQYVLRITDLEKGELLADRIENTSDTAAWSEDGPDDSDAGTRTLFYTTLDDARRPDRAWRHLLGTDPGEDVCLLHELDASFFVHVIKTRSRRYVLVELESHTTREIHFVEADRPLAPLRAFRKRRRGVEYWLDHREDRFWVRTNEGAPNFRLLTASIPGPDQEEAPGPDDEEAPVAERWEEVIPAREEVKLEDALVLQDHVAVLEREAGLCNLWVRELTQAPEKGGEHALAFPEPSYRLQLGETHAFRTSVVRLVYESPITPDTDYDYDLATRTLRLVKRKEVPGLDPEAYQTTRIHARASDGTRIPITLLHGRGLERHGDNPCLLTGYGAYGFPFDARFDAPVFSLVDRGFVYAIAHVRGGGELGERWHDEGKMLRKKNSFTDFIHCAEHLIEQGYTKPDRLAVRGRSAGGLLVGAVLNLRPDLFEAALVGVPFVDVYNTMQDSTIPLTVIEYEEWGNPSDPEYADYIRSYSPYENVRPQAYPHILATAGLNDPRVQYWEPAKWVARLRRIKTNENQLLLRTEMGAGHGGPSGRYQALEERAFEYAFVMRALDFPAQA